MNSKRTIETTEETRRCCRCSFCLGYARKTCRGIRARGFRRLVTDVKLVPALSFCPAAIEDLNLNCDGFVAWPKGLRRGLSAPAEAERRPLETLNDTHRRIWTVFTGAESLSQR